MLSRTAIRAAMWLMAAGCLFSHSRARAEDPIKVDFVMFSEPRLVLTPTVVKFSTKLKPLWLESLQQPEADLRRLAAESFALAATRKMPDLADTAAPLAKALEDAHPIVRIAAARALVAINARQFADQLLTRSEADGLDLMQVVDPALAAWDYQPARAVWLRRLSTGAPRRLLTLAIQGLGQVREAESAVRLQEIALDPKQSADLRVVAAEALARIQPQDLEGIVEPLLQAGKASRTERLVAVRLLGEHRGKPAETLLLGLAQDSDPAIAGAAMERLFAISPDLVLPLADAAVLHNDAKVRLWGARSWIARPTPDHMTRLGTRLDDLHPGNRAEVREALRTHANNQELRPVIQAAAMLELASDRWRGLEQAALLLGDLDHEPAATRLVELMDHKRQEVLISATWALRKLAVPETLPALYDKAQRLAENHRKPGPLVLELEPQTALLFEAFGLMKYRAAEPLLMEYLPKSGKTGLMPRGAAIWALGRFYEGNPDPKLVPRLVERLQDINSMPPEIEIVRTMCAVCLGRMKAKAALPDLQKYQTFSSETGAACSWAITEITGEKLKRPPDNISYSAGWFIEPLEP